MDKLQLYEVIAGGEDSYAEFKRDVNQRSDFAAEMIAFANTESGQILVGVADDGTIVGLNDPKQAEEAILNIGRQNCNPPLIPALDRISTDYGIVLVVNVPKRTGPPHETNSGQCYLRVGSTKRLCTPFERARLLQAAGLYHFDETPVPGTGIEQIHMSALAEYYRRIYEKPLDTSDVPLASMLQAMRFLVPDLDGAARLSVAGLLLFGEQPEDHLYYARISAVRWLGLAAGEEILDRQEITGRLPDQIEQAEKFVLRNTRLSTSINGLRQADSYEYPRPALREAIVNAVAHRDYSLDGAQILLYVFDDRLEIRSPGTLPNSVTLQNIKTHYSKPRNETIARVLFNLGYVNILGSGIPRMIRLMREHSGREPDLEVLGQQFLVRLWAPKTKNGSADS